MGTIFKPLRLQQCKIGMNVTYYPFVKRRIEGEDPIKTVITSEPWEASGEVVIQVDGVRGGVSIKHLAERNG